MPKKERWGRPHTDHRDWTVYNERLVRRGEFYLSLEFVDHWADHLYRINAGKRGHPYQYPDLFIQWMACVHLFLQMPYRQMEGFTRKLSLFIPGLQSADYTTLFRRIKDLDLSLSVDPTLSSSEVVVAVDSTGIKVTNRGEWMREKWQVRRGWIKVHTIVDIESGQILGLEITDETIQDDPLFTSLLDQAESCCGSIRQVLGDGGYDRKDVFNILENRGIMSGIKTRENAATRSRGSPYRAECVREKRKSGGYRPWMEKTGYGKRWKVEGVFSAVKRIFGESVRSSSREGMMREAMMKFQCYNMLVVMVK
jgi:hypothetical protein